MTLISLQHIINSSIFVYAVVLFLIFALLILVACLELNAYLKKASHVNYKQLLATPHAPGVSVIVPVIDDASNIVERLRALLSIRYNNFELIVVNDGSSDDTIAHLIEAYQLQVVDFAGHEQLKTEQITNYYRSSNPVYSKLTVIDKVRGGRSDALNAGINLSEKKLVLCLERNCFLDQMALLKMVKQVLNDSKRVIAVGTAIYISNSSKSRSGYLTNARFPKLLLTAFKALHYLRVFLIERPALSRYNGLHSTSGAVTLFDREIVLLAGGYTSMSLKANFELNVRMCSYMHENNLQYKIANVPEPICWTEEPRTFAGVCRQEIDNARGSIQTLIIHKRLLLKRKYGNLGMISYPYWVFSELITPIFKLLTLLALIGLVIVERVSLETSVIVILMTYCIAVLLSAISLVFEEKSYRPYTSLNDLFKILLAIFLEPIIYQPLTVYWKLVACLTVKRTY